MSDTTPAAPAAKGGIDVAICVDRDAFTRLCAVIRHLCVGLFDHGVRVRIITPSPEADVLASLGPLEVLTYRDLAWPLHRWRFRRLVADLSLRPPTLIYAMSSGSYPLSDALAGAFDVEAVAQVSTMGDVESLHFMRRLAYIIGASEPLLDSVRARDELSRTPCSLVRPGVLRGAELTCFRDEEATPSMVCTAKLDVASGIDVVVEGVALVHEHRLDLLTFLLGTGRHERMLRQTVRSRNLTAQVTFARPVGAMTEVLRGADLFVLPPGDEDVSAHPLQAMAGGTAVICFSGGVADCFHDGETAIVCDERTARALADAIERLLSDHALAHRIADNAREYVKKHHQMSTMAERTVHVFEQVAMPRKTFRIPT